MADVEDNQSDYCEDEEDEDDEATLDEEDALNGEEDYADELNDLQAEGEMSLEELQRKYYGAAVGESDDNNAQLAPPPTEENLPQLPAASSVPSPSNARRTGSLRGRIFTAIAGSCDTLSQTIGAYFKPEDLEEDDTEDYVPPELWKKEIRIGKEYQVSDLPNCAPKTTRKRPFSPRSDQRAETLWAPSDECCAEQLVVAFLLDCEQIRAGEKPHSARNNGSANRRREKAATTTTSGEPVVEIVVPDDEDALLALYQADYNVKEAKARAPFEWPLFSPANAPTRTQPAGPWRPWSDAECETFEEAMLEHNKQFWKIRRDFLPQRTVGELVTFYYSWKKSERHDMWKQEKCQRDQQLDAKTADLMGQIAESILHGTAGSEESGDGGATTAAVAAGALKTTKESLMNNGLSSGSE